MTSRYICNENTYEIKGKRKIRIDQIFILGICNDPRNEITSYRPKIGFAIIKNIGSATEVYFKGSLKCIQSLIFDPEV